MVRCGVLAVPSREEAQRHTGRGWEQLGVPPEELEEVATADTRPGWATENVDRWKCRPQRCMQSERSRQFSLDSNTECATSSLNMHQLCKMISRPTNKDLSRRRKLPSPTLQSNPSTVWLIWMKWKCEHSQVLNVLQSYSGYPSQWNSEWYLSPGRHVIENAWKLSLCSELTWWTTAGSPALYSRRIHQDKWLACGFVHVFFMESQICLRVCGGSSQDGVQCLKKVDNHCVSEWEKLPKEFLEFFHFVSFGCWKCSWSFLTSYSRSSCRSTSWLDTSK